MDEEARKIIKKAINSEEFKAGLVEAFDLFNCVVKIHKNNNLYALESLRKNILDKRINELKIQAWFEQLEWIEKR